MAISHDIGLFFPFKVNRQLTKEEKQSRFIQGKRRKCFGEASVLDFDTVVRVNTTYIEVIDKFYPTKGKITAFLLVPCILIAILIIAMTNVVVFQNGSLPFFVFVLLACCVCLFFCPVFFLRNGSGVPITLFGSTERNSRCMSIRLVVKL